MSQTTHDLKYICRETKIIWPKFWLILKYREGENEKQCSLYFYRTIKPSNKKSQATYGSEILHSCRITLFKLSNSPRTIMKLKTFLSRSTRFQQIKHFFCKFHKNWKHLCSLILYFSLLSNKICIKDLFLYLSSCKRRMPFNDKKKLFQLVTYFNKLLNPIVNFAIEQK